VDEDSLSPDIFSPINTNRTANFDTTEDITHNIGEDYKRLYELF
jgi:hypothetical protein